MTPPPWAAPRRAPAVQILASAVLLAAALLLFPLLLLTRRTR